jgi:hypothetical protein
VKYRRHAPGQEVRKLRETDRMLGEVSGLVVAWPAPGVSQPTREYDVLGSHKAITERNS